MNDNQLKHYVYCLVKHFMKYDSEQEVDIDYKKLMNNPLSEDTCKAIDELYDYIKTTEESTQRTGGNGRQFKDWPVNGA